MKEENRDVIRATDVSTFPVQTGSAKDRILDIFKSLNKEDESIWASVKTISEESQVSNIYTRHVLDALLKSGTIEKGVRGKKTYFRLCPTQSKKKVKTE